MANTLTAIMGKILARSLPVLREKCLVLTMVNTDFKDEVAKKGDTINVPVSSAWEIEDVVPSSIQPVPVNSTEVTVPIALNNWKKSKPFFLTDKDLGEIDANASFLPNKIGEAIRALANGVNTSVFAEARRIYGYTGTAGTTPFASAVTDAMNLRKVLNDQLCPQERFAIIDTACEANMLARPEFANFEQSGDPNVKIKGILGEKYGFNWGYDEQVPYHTAGTITTGLIAKAATAVAVGATSVVATTAASTGACALKYGDIILFAGQAQTYVLTADATQATAATDVTLSIDPPLKTALVGSEAITVKASHRLNIAGYRDAIALAVRPLESSVLMDKATNRLVMVMQDEVTGLPLRLEVLQQYKQVAWEFDILWGTRCVRPAWAARLAG